MHINNEVNTEKEDNARKSCNQKRFIMLQMIEYFDYLFRNIKQEGHDGPEVAHLYKGPGAEPV
jgi:hypothetical protein